MCTSIGPCGTITSNPNHWPRIRRPIKEAGVGEGGGERERERERESGHAVEIKCRKVEDDRFRAQELCENRGGRPGLPSLINLPVPVDVKQHFS